MQSIQTVSENTIYVGASDRRLAKFENLIDLPHELAEQFAERFRQPEMFMRVDGKIVAAPMPDEQVQGGMSY